MKSDLNVRYEIIYHDESGRHVYWPADTRSYVLAERLREARAKGLTAHIAEVIPPPVSANSADDLSQLNSLPRKLPDLA